MAKQYTDPSMFAPKKKNPDDQLNEIIKGVKSVANNPTVQAATKAGVNALNQAWKGFSDWASPPPLSPVPEKTATRLLEPGGIKQAVNNVVAMATLRPELMRKFPTSTIPRVSGQVSLPTTTPRPTVTPTMAPTASPTPYPTITPEMKPSINLIQQLFNRINPSPTPTATPTPTPTPGPTREDYIQAMQEMIPEINPNTRLPVADYATTIYDETQKYPIFKKYPFLAVAQAILESSGFQQATAENPKTGYNPAEPKRALGYAPYVEGYNPQDLKQVIADYASALGGRDAAIEKQTNPEGWQSRMSTASNYQKFRDSGNLADLANVYAPASDNPGTGGQTYADRLQWIMDRYQEALKKRVNDKAGKAKK